MIFAALSSGVALKLWGHDWKQIWHEARAQAWARNVSSALYLVALVLILIASSVAIRWPQGEHTKTEQAESEEVLRARRLLLQTANKIVRYQHYYREVYGRFTGDLRSLGIPNDLVGGTVDEIRKNYEIFIELRSGQRFSVRARGRPLYGRLFQTEQEVLRMDQDFSIHANFPVPNLGREFLVQEADRVLRLKERNREAVVGIAQNYWMFLKEGKQNEASWKATGIRGRVIGATREKSRKLASLDFRSENSLFSKITSHLRDEDNTGGFASSSPSTIVVQEAISLQGIYRFLELARYSQHVYFREFGHHAVTWEDLDEYVSFNLVAQGNSYNNASLEPVELSRNDFRMRVRGTSGDILGEVFSVDKFGNIEQIRYTDVIVERLRATTEFLSNPNRFQISEVPDESSPVIKSPRRQKRVPSSE